MQMHFNSAIFWCTFDRTKGPHRNKWCKTLPLRFTWTHEFRPNLRTGTIYCSFSRVFFSPSPQTLCGLWSMKSGSFPRDDITTLCSVTNDGLWHSNGNIKFPLDMCSIQMRMLLMSVSLSLSLPQSFPDSSVSLRPGDGGWHHPRLWYYCLQRLVGLHWGQTWKVGDVWVCG